VSGVWNVVRVTYASSGAAESAADEAMDRYAGGEPGAFEELYDLMAPRLYGYFLRQTRQPAASEDLVQQIFLQIHAARGKFIRQARVSPWAFAMARRLLIDRARRGRFEPSLEGDGFEFAFSVAATHAPLADDIVHAQRLGTAIERELESLPEAQREAFELVAQRGLSHREAAEVLGTTVGAAKLRVHRAYLALRAVLGVWMEVR
jgi:RNA polymerase sigma-70 factor (ECF subfamily)